MSKNSVKIKSIIPESASVDKKLEIYKATFGGFDGLKNKLNNSFKNFDSKGFWIREDQNRFTGKMKDMLEKSLNFKEQSMTHATLAKILNIIYEKDGERYSKLKLKSQADLSKVLGTIKNDEYRKENNK